MKISAVVRNAPSGHELVVATDGAQQPVPVSPRTSARGSGVSGGELLMAALATCYCNDLFREAERLGMPIDSVEVEASAEFRGIGLAASNIAYRARVTSTASAEEVEALLRITDAVAEGHNTVRSGVPVTLEQS